MFGSEKGGSRTLAAVCIVVVIVVILIVLAWWLFCPKKASPCSLKPADILSRVKVVGAPATATPAAPGWVDLSTKASACDICNLTDCSFTLKYAPYTTCDKILVLTYFEAADFVGSDASAKNFTGDDRVIKGLFGATTPYWSSCQPCAPCGAVDVQLPSGFSSSTTKKIYVAIFRLV